MSMAAEAVAGSVMMPVGDVARKRAFFVTACSRYRESDV
jgi:hypothetical protein